MVCFARMVELELELGLEPSLYNGGTPKNTIPAASDVHAATLPF